MNIASLLRHRVSTIRLGLAVGLVASVPITASAAASALQSNLVETSAPRTYTSRAASQSQDADRAGDEGWTVFTPSADSRIIYVSSSEGDDATGAAVSLAESSGRAAVGEDPHLPQGEIRPFRTIQRAMQSLRDGYPDWLLFKRGDVWEDEWIGRWRLAGRSESEKIVIGTYGDWSLDRPRILTGERNGMVMGEDDVVRHLAVTGLHMVPHTRGVDDNPSGIKCNSQYAEDILFEDLYIEGYLVNFVVQSRTDRMARDITIRRSIVVDSWSVGGHAQGIFAKQIDGLTIEESVFDHNGWNDEVEGAGPTMFRHNMYLTTDNENVVVRNNIITRASATGCQARTAGQVTGNIFAGNPHGLQFGFSLGVAYPHELGSVGMAYQNIIFGGLPREEVPGNTAMSLGNLGEREMVQVRENLLIGQPGTKNGMVIDGENNFGIHGLTVRDNTIIDFDRIIRIKGVLGEQLTDVRIVRNVLQQFYESAANELVDLRDSPNSDMRIAGNTYFSARSPHRWFRIPVAGQLDLAQWAERANEFRARDSRVEFVDPGRTLASYHATLGGEESLEAILNELREQRRGAWRTELDTKEIASYIREGYEVSNDSGQSRLPAFRRGGSSNR